MSTKVTMTDAAYNCMLKRKKEIEFPKLWADVAKTMKIPEEKLIRKKRQFYAELMEDHRFVSLKGNKWDLRSRRSYSEVSAETAVVMDEDDETEDIEDRDVLDLPRGEDVY
ncbi:MAG: DNA-directed RNA polymerase subunit delta [Solobacterium sp.]|nr:DNA-directed RNA polymerase subunit delta [Solobacterium sp.]